MELQVGQYYKDGFQRVLRVDSLDGSGTYPVTATIVESPAHFSDPIGDKKSFMLDGRFLESEKPSDSDLKERVFFETREDEFVAGPAPAPEPAPKAEPQFKGMNDPARFEGGSAEPEENHGSCPITDFVGSVDSGPSKNKLRLQAFIYALSETVPLGKLEEAATYAADQERGEYDSKAAAAASFLLAGEVLEEK